MSSYPFQGLALGLLRGSKRVRVNSHGVGSLSPIREHLLLLWPGQLGISGHRRGGVNEEIFKGEFNPMKMVGPQRWLLHGSLYPQPLWDTVTSRQVPNWSLLSGTRVEEHF